MKKTYITVIDVKTGRQVNTIERDTLEDAISYCKTANRMFQFYKFLPPN